MATLEQIAAQVVTLRQELNESRRREEDLNNRLQAVQSTGAMQAALQEMVSTQKAILEASKRPDKKLTLVDNVWQSQATLMATRISSSGRSGWKLLLSPFTVTSAKRWLGQKTKRIQSATHP